ncbi:zinc finger protein 536-like [Huso huso]|uniref:Zinc finger protein 536-like n=1 Tax=Huso huso TaxID=61971 RepID=A0ABR0YWY8_HUSHU
MSYSADTNGDDTTSSSSEEEKEHPSGNLPCLHGEEGWPPVTQEDSRLITCQVNGNGQHHSDDEDDEGRDQMQTESAAKDSLGLMSSMSLEKQWQGMNLLSSQGVPPGVVKPEQAHLEQQMNMLSVLRAYSTENLAVFNGLGNSSNTTGGIKRPDLPAQRPFQCRYCPYSASQKGNLKTHVLCVHRMPFDNSQYPDRRFKRSRVDSDTSGNSEDMNTMTPGSSGENTPEAGRVQE